MGQILTCTRRKQLEKFADEEPKLPRSPIAPARETIYIAYVVLLVVVFPQLVLISHIRVMGPTGSGKTTVCPLVDSDEAGPLIARL